MISASSVGRALLVCMLLVGATRSARAGDPDPVGERANDRSDQLFRDGRAAFKAGDCEAAIPLFEESERIEPAVGTLINLALCEERLERLAAARATLTDALARALPSDSRRTLIQDRIAELGARISATAADAPRPPAPAAVVLLPKANEGATSANRGADIASPGVPAAVDSARARRRSIGRALLGAGAAGIAVGLVFGGLVLYENAQVNAAHCDATRACDPSAVPAARWGSRFSFASTATTVLGIASAGASVYFLFGGSGKSNHYFAVRMISPVPKLPQ